MLLSAMSANRPDLARAAARDCMVSLYMSAAGECRADVLVPVATSLELMRRSLALTNRQSSAAYKAIVAGLDAILLMSSDRFNWSFSYAAVIDRAVFTAAFQVSCVPAAVVSKVSRSITRQV